jgi:tryptophan halogenase
MRVGRNRNSWVANCISIGLSSGFIEPLESTGIYFIEAAVKLLFDNFPTKSAEPPLRDNFNQNLNRLYEEIRDFIVLHYCLTQRDDTPFWRANLNHAAIPDTLAERLELWRHKVPSANDDPGGLHIFAHFNWAYILIGMGRYGEAVDRIAETLNQQYVTKFFDRVQNDHRNMLGKFPDHTNNILALHARRAAAK